MDVSWDYKLEDWQNSNPVVFSTQVVLPDGFIFPTELMLMKVFKTDRFKKGSGRLKAWGRSKDSKGAVIHENSPHWIAVRNGTPLHLDPPYPRYSHHLKVRVDEGIFVRGLDKVELKLATGIFYILDTHSPHQVFNKSPVDGWNVAISIDSHTKLNPSETIQRCVEFGQNSEFF